MINTSAGGTIAPARLALDLTANGWHVFPLNPRDKRPLANCPACTPVADCSRDDYAACPCLPAGRWCHGVRAATINPGRIHAWWSRQPDAVPAAATGPSGLILIDLDNHTDQPPADPTTGLLPGIELDNDHTPGGLDSIRTGRDVLLLLARLRGGHHPWPAAPQHQPVSVITPSGGRHLWYRAPAANGTGRLRQALGELGWQIDIKAGWSYGIAPGTTARTGTYRLVAGDPAHPGHMPHWLTREVLRTATTQPTPPPPVTPIRPGPGDGPAAYLTTVLNRGTTELTALTDGRKNALSALAYKAGGLLTWAGLPRSQVEEQLVQAGTASGLPERLTHRIVQRALDNGLARPLPPPRGRHTAH